MKKHTNKLFIFIAVTLLAGLISFAYVTDPARSRPMGDYSNVDGLIVDGTFGTATPQIVVKPTGGNVAIEVQNSGGTPVYQVNSAGAVVGSGGQSGVTNLVVSAPTAIGTATPAVLINNAGVSNLLEVRDSSTPVFTVGQAGAVTAAGAMDMSAQAITNIGSTGTDFSAQGGLTTARGITITVGSLTLGTVAQSGAVKYGVATDAISGTTVAHGLGSTPTSIVLTSMYPSGAFTRTVYVLAADATNFTIAIEGGGVVAQNVYWMAGQ